MRVAVNVEQLLHEAPGGIGRYTAELVRLLPGAGTDIEVVGFTARHSSSAVRAALARYGLSGLHYKVLPLPRPLLYDAWHLLALAGPVRHVGPVDVVHAPSVAVPPTGRVPLVVTVHDAAPILLPDAFTRRGRWFHRRGLEAAARRADLVIAVSRACAEELAAHTAIPGDRIRVVHHGVDTRRAEPEEIQRVRHALRLDDRPYVVWIGVRQPRKNVDVLVEAFSRLLATVDLPHRLVLGGPSGWLEGTTGAAERLGERLRLLGSLGAEQVSPLLAAADAFAFPSRHEGFGLPVLEAMAQGTPVVCSDIPALAEVAKGAARLVPPDDVDGWVEALQAVLTDGSERERLRARGLVRAAEFSWERCARETVAVYAEALHR